MKNHGWQRQLRVGTFMLVFLLFFLAALAGCTRPDPPLSPGATAFMKEVKDCITKLSQPLVEPVLKQDVKAVNEVLQKVEPEALKLCRMCPFTFGVIDKQGYTLSIYPMKKEALGDFSQYQVVADTLKNRKISQQKLFLQDGSQIYIICAPILHAEELAGILALALNTAEAQQRWGISEKEFSGLDFNR